jgi:hypothetical protein
MDFRDANAVGISLYHCHILKHEDMGMMGVIRVLPSGIATKTELSGPTAPVKVATEMQLTAHIHAHGPQAGSPSGTVQFLIDGIPAGKPISLSNGQAVFATSFGSGSAHHIVAAYSGDAHYDESISRPIRISVAGL